MWWTIDALNSVIQRNSGRCRWLSTGRKLAKLIRDFPQDLALLDVHLGELVVINTDLLGAFRVQAPKRLSGPLCVLVKA
jgi:hypothetical protein